ncbi:MAG: hypothetical protein DMG88_07835 [Acidobacteria bacterium]|nr:MAG: hypothetical protein DMG88_07835 [Acidobacteriota bacterium]
MSSEVCPAQRVSFSIRATIDDEGAEMSGINGDKSRFHRERKQKIARRKRNRELLKTLAERRKSAASSGSKPSAVSA